MRVPVAFALVVLCACGSVQGAGAPIPDTFGRSVIVPREHTLIGESVFDFLSRTRPTFLRMRTPLTHPLSLGEDAIGVYLNGAPAGGIDALRTLPANYVYDVRRLSASESMARYGRSYRDGAIEVRMARR